jgi:hypothetical protein|nr:hypothetical protein [Phenylobacterium sp.]
MTEAIPPPSLIDTVQKHAASSAFGRPLVQNNLRAMVVEAIVDLALPDGWRWCSGDWAAWDFEHADGTYLEVKQSAAQQTWAAPTIPTQPRFDIAHRQGRWDGAVWIAEPGRFAHIYVFAHHPVVGDTADHRDPLQWRFYVVPTTDLPVARTVSLTRLKTLTRAHGFEELASGIEETRLTRFTPPEPTTPDVLAGSAQRLRPSLPSP